MGLALDEPKANEKPVHVNGIDVLVEDEVGLLVDGATIDYVSQPWDEGFVIKGAGDC